MPGMLGGLLHSLYIHKTKLLMTKHRKSASNTWNSAGIICACCFSLLQVDLIHMWHPMHTEKCRCLGNTPKPFAFLDDHTPSAPLFCRFRGVLKGAVWRHSGQRSLFMATLSLPAGYTHSCCRNAAVLTSRFCCNFVRSWLHFTAAYTNTPGSILQNPRFRSVCVLF